MTTQELVQIGQALDPFLRFLRDTEKGEGWHAARQQLWARVDK